MRRCWIVLGVGVSLVACSKSESSPHGASAQGGAGAGAADAGGGARAGSGGSPGGTGGGVGDAGGSANCGASGVSKGPWTTQASSSGGLVRWEACRADVSPMLRLTPEGGGTAVELEATVAPFEIENRYSSLIPLDIPDDLPGTYYMHEVSLSSLEQGTCYRYELVADSQRTGRFCTAAAPGSSFSFLAIGDTNPGLHPEVADAIDTAAGFGFDFSVHVGDIQYYDSGLETWASWFPLMKSLLSRGAFFPALGNHEFEKPDEYDQYINRFFSSSGFDGTEGTYRFGWGGVWFFALDTEQPITDDGFTSQYDWFVEQLTDAASQPGYRFSVVYFHRPFISCGDVSPKQTERYLLEPLFEQHDVRLVLQGHMHGYERFQIPLPGGKSVTYVTTAGGGGRMGDPSAHPDRVDCDKREMVSDQFHVTQFSVSETEVVGRAIDVEGTVFDQFVVP